jgi:hypothetical protein
MNWGFDVGVPSSSLLKILEGEGGDVHVVGRVAICGIHLGPKWASIGVQAWFVCLHPFAAFLLTMTQHFAKNASLSIFVGVVAGTLSPGFVLLLQTLLLVVVVASWLLQTILVVVGGLEVGTNSLNLRFVVLHNLCRIHLVGTFGLLSRSGLNGSQFDSSIQPEFILIL